MRCTKWGDSPFPRQGLPASGPRELLPYVRFKRTSRGSSGGSRRLPTFAKGSEFPQAIKRLKFLNVLVSWLSRSFVLGGGTKPSERQRAQRDTTLEEFRGGRGTSPRETKLGGETAMESSKNNNLALTPNSTGVGCVRVPAARWGTPVYVVRTNVIYHGVLAGARASEEYYFPCGCGAVRSRERRRETYPDKRETDERHRDCCRCPVSPALHFTLGDFAGGCFFLLYFFVSPLSAP